MMVSVNKELEKICYSALVDGPKLKKEINTFVVDYIVSNNLTHLIYGLNNLGVRLEGLKAKGKVSNTANCKDANEGLYATGTWFVI